MTDDSQFEDKESLVQEIVRVTEVSKLSLNQDDTLVIRIYSDQVDEGDLMVMRSQLKQLFPYNKVVVLAVGADQKIEIDVITQPQPVQLASPCASPVSYCNDCSCGKKAMIESQQGSQDEKE